MAATERVQTDDERRLAELGYKQELDRRMSGFANFAMSFTIISILSGALTLYGTGINYGGPSRMVFAFSRDQAVPGHRRWSKLNRNYVPANAVVLICFLAFLLAAPAWSGDAFFVYAAVTSVATIGLYVAYIIPVFLRFRAGENFDPGPWSLGRWHKPINIVAIIWVIFICILFIMPVTDAGVWWGDDFDYKSANYAPIVFLIVVTAVTVWWHTSAKNWFTGPKRTIDQEIEDAVEEVEPPKDASGGTAPAPA